MDIKRKKTLAIVFTVFAIVLTIGTAYAFVTRTLTGTKKVTLTAGTLSLVLDEKNEITISDALPMYDQVGMIQEEVFEFDLINETNNSTEYVLKLKKISTENELSEDDVKYYLTKDGVGKPALLSTLTDGVVDTGTIEGKDTIDYTLRLWISDTVTEKSAIEGKSLSYRLVVEASMVDQKDNDSSSCPVLAKTEPNEPELTSGMIAVTYNETDKTWVKADTTNNNWYDYDNQMWANAVTVTETARASYMAAEAGEPISMDDINTMWVWIPRYSYTIKQPIGRMEQKCSELGEITLDSPSECRETIYPEELRAEGLLVCQDFDSSIVTEKDCGDFIESIGVLPFKNFEGLIDYLILDEVLEDTRTIVQTYPDNVIDTTSIIQPGAIDIRFIKSTVKDTGTGKCENCTENWVTPEGFTFGTEEIPGFWMGKFETSTLETCYAQNYSINTDCDLLTLTPQIKPGVPSWRGARVSTFFEASRLMQASDDALTYNADTYGFDAIGTSSMDTHMLKNTEWGIVAYLSQSKYGKHGNPNYTGANKEVYINQSSEYITGMSSGRPSGESQSTQVAYNVPETGYGASTTGTIYGVYDMSGGGFEYVMANYNNYSGTYTGDNSGFCGKITNSDSELTEDCRKWPDEKYYDLYTSDVLSSAYKFGDATYETSNWYYDYAELPSADFPWIRHGGRNEMYNDEGIFNSQGWYGRAGSSSSTRFAIKP